jgi:hypothetical protein
VLFLFAGSSADGGAAVDGLCVRGQDMPVIPRNVVSRAITPENPTGDPGQGGKAIRPVLGEGRKGSPCFKNIERGQTVTLMDIEGCGVIRHVWITLSKRKPVTMRNLIIRMYWDNSPIPSVEVPLGDFFGTAHGRTVNLASAYVSTPMGKGFNCWFPMPFGKHARITLQNDSLDKRPLMQLFFQIDYEQRSSLPADTGRFHAQFRRKNPTVLKQDYVILDGVEGPGMYVGTVIGVRALSPDWWGEGEMKMYIDGDEEYPTICGTGSEDYFLAAYGMYEFQTPYHGCTLNLTNDFFTNPLVSMYRWHGPDPIYFKKSLKATMQQIGYKSEGGLYERSDDWCSTAFWYQLAPISKMPPLPDRDARTAGIIEPRKPKPEVKK